MGRLQTDWLFSLNLRFCCSLFTLNIRFTEETCKTKVMLHTHNRNNFTMLCLCVIVISRIRTKLILFRNTFIQSP